MAEPKHRRKGQIINRNGVRTVRVYLGKDANGKRIYVNRTVKTGAKAADSVLDGLLDAVSGGNPTVKPTRMTVNALLDEWLQLHVKENCRERTYDYYVWMLDAYVRPRLGKMMATLLSHTEIEANYSYLRHARKKKIGSQACRTANALLSSAYNWGVKTKRLSMNPCAHVTLPPLNRKKRRALPAEQLSRFLQAAKQDRWYVILSLALESGFRPEEYLGLTWSDINLDRGEIAVVRTLVWRKGRKAKPGVEKRPATWYFSTPKTERGDRTLIVSESLRLLLTDHRRKQLEERLKATDYNDNGFVFAMGDGRPVLHRTLDRRHFKPILKRAGLPQTTRIYDLRHSCATLLIKNGESPKVVADRLGHSDPAFTLKTYVDTDSGQQKAASEKLAKILAR